MTYNYTREYGNNNPYEKEIFYGGKRGGNMGPLEIETEEWGKIRIEPIWGEKIIDKRHLEISEKGRVTERECDRLLTGSQPKGCGGSTPPPTAKKE